MANKFISLLTVLFLLAVAFTPVFGQDDTEEELDAEELKETYLAEFNRVLLEEIETQSLPPLALQPSPILEELAQQISDEIGCSDDAITFDIQRDILELGYEAYEGDTVARTTRVPLLPIVNLRPIVEMATFFTQDIWGTNIANVRYREIGIGVTPCIVEDGANAVGSTQQYALFVILGVQPNVVPVVIQYGLDEIEVDDVPVTVTLSVHEESSRPLGDIFGRAESMRLSSEPLTDDVEAQDYVPLVEWELTECGTNTVFYELTDREGMTLEGETSVEVVCSDE